MSVGTNIKKRRFELKMSQQELAEKMGYKTRSTIAKIESGENEVSESRLRKFATVLNTTVEALISEGYSSPEPAELSLNKTTNNAVVILAGGKSGKNRQNIPSQFINVHGKPVIVYCMEAYQSHPAIDDIYIVCLKGWESIVLAYAKQYGITKLKGIIPGKSSGMASLKSGVDYIKDNYSEKDILIIQEATRPLVTPETISKLLLTCFEKGSATICYPMNEYVQFISREKSAEYIDREAIIALQSPEAHCFSLVVEVLCMASMKNEMQESCFSMLMNKLGYEINFVRSDINNIKIAREEDLATFGVLVTQL